LSVEPDFASSQSFCWVRPARILSLAEYSLARMLVPKFVYDISHTSLFNTFHQRGTRLNHATHKKRMKEHASAHSEPATPATRLYQQSDKPFGLSLLPDTRKSVPSQTTSVVFESAERLGIVRLTLGACYFCVLSTSRRTLV
jgi:hypothetical protein